MQQPDRFRLSLALALACAFVLTIITLLSGARPAAATAAALTPADAATRARVSEAYGQLPLSFEANHGQAAAPIRFLARGGDYTLALSPDGAALDFPGAAGFRLRLLNAQPSPQMEGLAELPGKVNYLVGNDPQAWRTNVPTFAKVRYAAVYPGVDLVFYGKGRQLEYDFVVAPGADARVIRLAFENVQGVRLDAAGDLLVRTAAGELRQSKPVVYQKVDGERRVVAGGYRLLGKREVGFVIGAYDRSLPLVIDPVLQYLARTIAGERIAVDGQGNAYILATASSTVFTSVQGGRDLLILKLNAAGTQQLYTTIIGGTGTDTAVDIAVNAAGNAYLLCNSTSEDFPGAGPSTGYSVFVSQLSADGARPIFSTLAGQGVGAALTLDAAGNVYATGTGQLQIFRNGFLPLSSGVSSDGFAVKLNGQTREAEYSTYLGAEPRDIAVDRTGKLYLAGNTGGSRMLVIRNGFQMQPGGGSSQDAFLLKLDPQQTGNASLLYATYFGGEGGDEGLALAVDANGFAYLAGRTFSSDFPITPARRVARSGNIFLAKLDPAKAGAASLLWSSQLGSGELSGLALDAAGNAYATGSTSVVDFPVTPGALQRGLANGTCYSVTCGCPLMFGFCPARCQFQPPVCSDAFLSVVSADGSALLYSTYLGSDSLLFAFAFEKASDIALDAVGNVYITGISGLGATTGAFQQGGNFNGFVAKLTLGTRNPAATVLSAASFTGPELARDSLIVGFLDAAGAGADKLQALVRDSAGVEGAARVFFAGTGQINFQIPPGTATGPAAVYITSNGATISNGAVRIVDLAPGVFAANGNGRGVVAASVLYVRPDGSRLDAFTVRYDFLLGQFVPVPLDLSIGDIYLSLYGTGWRYRSPANGVTVKIGGVDGQVTYAGVQPTFIGVDQINVKIPKTLAGRGEVDVVVTVDGKAANMVRVSFK